MTILDNLDIPGVYRGMVPGMTGQLEVTLDVPTAGHPDYLAILGHPHSLQGGSMDNKVVTTMARAFRELGIASIRFNFRGVGLSEGTYDAGIGESEDMFQVLQAIGRPHLQVFFAGFSFGSYVAFRALTLYQEKYDHPTALITIAPSVQHYDYTSPLAPATPWLVIMGTEDEIVPLAAVSAFVQGRCPAPSVEYFADTGHFFHGKLLDLKASLQSYIGKWMVP